MMDSQFQFFSASPFLLEQSWVFLWGTTPPPLHIVMFSWYLCDKRGRLRDTRLEDGESWPGSGPG